MQTTAQTILFSYRIGGAWVLDRLWEQVGIKDTLLSLLQNREYKIPVERCIFAMVANRALSPASKRGTAKWVNEKEVWIDGVEKIELQNLYRSMDFLLTSQEQIQKEVFFEVANLLNLEVDLFVL